MFPACENCNETSRIHENLFAMLCRIRFNPARVDGRDEKANDEWQKIAGGVARVLPDVYRSMRMPLTEKRRRMRELGVQPEPGSTSADVPLISIKHPEFGEAAKTVARKLFLGLYYMRTGRILSGEGRVAFVWRTNSHSLNDFFAEFRPLLSMFPEVQRGKNMLGDQFSYAYSIAEAEPPSAIFGVVFNHAVAMLGVVMGDVSRFEIVNQHPDFETIVAPYHWE